MEAYSARASTAQTRLLKTIDVLDALRSQHALEISAAEHEKVKLVHEVDRWRSVVKNVEVEKDELKDVVEDLIEKGTSRALVLDLFPNIQFCGMDCMVLSFLFSVWFISSSFE